MIVNDMYYETFDGTDRSFISNIEDALFDTVRLCDTASFVFTVTHSEVNSKVITQVFKSEERALNEYSELMSLVNLNKEGNTSNENKD